MQTPSEDDVSRQEALKRRAEEHAQWKMRFFQSRPPPQFIPKPRRRRGPIAAAPLHSLHRRALELVRTGEGQAAPATPEAPPPDVDEPMNRRDAWRRKMALEAERRDPYTDINICTDPRRTVVVSSLHPKSLEEDMRLFGEQFGRVVSVRLICDRKGKSRRYGFVQFGLEAEARKAVMSSRKRRLHGRAVVMEMERGRLEPGFLPKRLAEARRQGEEEGGTSTTHDAKRLRVEERVHCPPQAQAAAVGSSCSGVGSNSRDEVDAFLDDIMNLT